MLNQDTSENLLIPAGLAFNLPVPEFWNLDNNSSASFKIQTSRSAYYMKSLPENFLDSIKKNNCLIDGLTSSGIGKNGVEAMFLGEMMSWNMSANFIFSPRVSHFY